MIKQLPHNIDRKEMTNIIYDTLMHNTQNTQFDIDFIEMQECDEKAGYLWFDYTTEKGAKRIFLKISVEDLQDNDEE